MLFEQWKWVGLLRCAQKTKSHFLSLCGPALPPAKVTSVHQQVGLLLRSQEVCVYKNIPQICSKCLSEKILALTLNCTAPHKLLGARLPRCLGVGHLLKAGL